MTEHTEQFRDQTSAGLTPTRLEVTESLRAVDRNEIDEILATPADALDRPDLLAVPTQQGVPESPVAADTLRTRWEDELDHLGLEAEEEPSPSVSLAPQAVEEPVREHRAVKWGVV